VNIIALDYWIPDVDVGQRWIRDVMISLAKWTQVFLSAISLDDATHRKRLMNMPTTRRSFVRSSVLATAVSALPTSALHVMAQPVAEPQGTPTGMPPIKLGLASYTFRNFTRAQMIDFMKQLHLTELNAKDVKDHLPFEATAEAAAVEDYAANSIHLHAIGALYFPKDEDDDIRSKFEYAKRAGVSVIVAGDPTPESLPRIERFVKEYDIRLAIHNHGPEDKIWHSPLDVLKVVKNMDPRLGCCIDIGHCVRAGTDVVEAIHAVGPRLFNMHAKDLTDFTAKESQVAVGDGIMPIRKIFEALIATKYQGFVDLEYEVHADDPMPGVISSFAYMRGVLAGMGYPTHAAAAA
jgi:sugar phosphate isomerase/epimerase